MRQSELNRIANKIQGILGAKLISLGRVASGRLINSLNHIVSFTGDSIDITITGLNYWRIVEYGVPADRIPYSGGKSTGAKSSRYIQGLMNWVQTKGLASGEQKIKSIAFAIANKHKQVGNPVDKSKLGFVGKSMPEIDAVYTDIVNTYQKELDAFAQKNLVKRIDL